MHRESMMFDRVRVTGEIQVRSNPSKLTQCEAYLEAITMSKGDIWEISQTELKEHQMWKCVTECHTKVAVVAC